MTQKFIRIMHGRKGTWYKNLVGSVWPLHPSKVLPEHFVLNSNEEELVNIEDANVCVQVKPIPKTIPGASTPKQYGIPEGAKELQDLIEHRNMNFAMGNIFKACYRMGHCDHSDSLRELNKIIWFAERELKRISQERNK